MLKRIAALLVCLAFSLQASASTFSLTDTQGRTHTLAGYQGKWVLVNLWATWCAPCLAEMPELEALSKARNDLVVLGLAIDGQNAQRVVQFAGKLGITYPIVAGNEKLAQQFKPRGVPTTILYDGSGKQILVKEGPITRQEIEKVLSQQKTN
ncbi:MAG: TlpA disulfide reductase family protein [Pseudomonadota bacterium]